MANLPMISKICDPTHFSFRRFFEKTFFKAVSIRIDPLVVKLEFSCRPYVLVHNRIVLSVTFLNSEETASLRRSKLAFD